MEPLTEEQISSLLVSYSPEWKLHFKGKTCYSYRRDDLSISCEVYPGSNDFQFKFLTKKLHLLLSGKLGPITNREHFEKGLSRFLYDRNSLF